MKFYIHRVAIFFLTTLCLNLSAYAAVNPLSLELKNVNLVDALYGVAQFLNMNIIISPEVKGWVTLRLQNAMPQEAFNLLLAAHGLARWREGNTWLIGSQNELIKRKEEAVKWQVVSNDVLPLVWRHWQIHYAKAEDIAHLLQDDRFSFLSKRGHLRVDVRTNTIFIQDVATIIEKMDRWIKQLDVPAQQIAIEARLVSIDTDVERELGINFATGWSSSEQGGSSGKPLLEKSGQYALAVVHLPDTSFLDVKLSALENKGHAELISTPSLFSTNLQPASIEAGEEVPYQETSENGGTTVVFKKAVLGLKVTPQILPGRKVLLQLQINQDRPSNKMVLGMPTISTRQIITSILVDHGQTIVLGGVYERNDEVGERGLPYINRIPLLKLLVTQRNMQRNKRELLIFVTPKIMTSDT